MARAAGPVAQGSLLDRLVEHPAERGGPSLTRLREGLRRDLESLLNTRRRFLGWPAELEELDRSLLSYGLRDLTHETLSSSAFRRDFAEQVTRLLQRSEPRIQVRDVQLLDNADPLDRRVRFRVTGSVRFGEERQTLSFDSFLDPLDCDIVVRDQ